MTVCCLFGCATVFHAESQEDLERPSHVDAENWVPDLRVGVILHDRGRAGMMGRLFAYVDGEWMPVSLRIRIGSFLQRTEQAAGFLATIALRTASGCLRCREPTRPVLLPLVLQVHVLYNLTSRMRHVTRRGGNLMAEQSHTISCGTEPRDRLWTTLPTKQRQSDTRGGDPTPSSGPSSTA